MHSKTRKVSDKVVGLWLTRTVRWLQAMSALMFSKLLSMVSQTSLCVSCAEELKKEDFEKAAGDAKVW